MEVIKKSKIEKLLSSYKSTNIAIATICSHSALQIFYSAKKYGFKTIGITTKERKAIYDAFTSSRPDDYIIVDNFSDIPVDELVSQNALMIPHGSLIEYTGDKILSLEVPIFGNRNSLLWEKNRVKMLEWLSSSGLKTPKKFNRIEDIDRLSIVKLPGAKGGAGYVLVSSPEEFVQKVGSDINDLVVQEFLVGVRIYPHFFFSPFETTGYKTKHGCLEMLGIDRRIESNADEIYRSLAAGLKKDPTFVIIGNEPIVIRESLLYNLFKYAEAVVEKSFDLFGGIIGPFCLELLITDKLEIYAFEISARIVAGTSAQINYSPYALFTHGHELSMGDRIMAEIKKAIELNRLNDIFY